MDENWNIEHQNIAKDEQNAKNSKNMEEDKLDLLALDKVRWKNQEKIKYDNFTL